MAMMIANDRFHQQRGHVWVSEGLTPILGSRKNPAPHVSLPAGEYNFETRSSYVIPQGTFVAVEDKMLVPASGTGFEVTYDGQDVFAGVQDKTGKKVAAGDKHKFEANKPVGVVVWDILQNPATLPNGFQTHTTQTAPTIRTEGVIVLPIVYAVDAAKAPMTKYVEALYGFKAGDLIAPDFDFGGVDCPSARPGGIRKFVEKEVTLGAAYADNKSGGTDKIPADSISQRVGRVIAVEDENTFSKQGLDKIHGDGVDVQSDSTHGFPRHIWNEFKATATDATKKAKFARKIVYVNIECR